MKYRSWVEQKRNLASALGDGALGGSYAEGATILCATISAMSSLLWCRSKGTDGNRFVEIVTRFPPLNVDPTRVSCPLLAAEFPQLRQKLGISKKSFLLTEDADKSEAEILEIGRDAGIPKLKKNIRRYSYANLLYEQIRCGFVHEYQAGKSATESNQMTKIFGIGKHQISYVNTAPDADGTDVLRLIHFPLDWISAVTEAIANGMDRERAIHNECAIHKKNIFENLRLNIPQIWWRQGGCTAEML